MNEASREILLRVIAEQREVTGQLRQRVESLETRLSGGGSGERDAGAQAGCQGR